MIHSENGITTLKGNSTELAAELAVAIARFNEDLEKHTSKIYADEVVRKIFAAAHLDPEKLNKQGIRLVDDVTLLKVMTDAHIRILNGFMKDDDEKIEAALGMDNERPKVDVALLFACICEILFSNEENAEE